MGTSYTPEGYGAIRGGCQQSAAAVVPILHDLVAPTRVVDVGGGEGWWAAQFAILGCEATVVDDSSPEHAKIRGVRFERSDLSADPAVIPEADLALCLEVAEHLPETSARSLIGALCGSAPVIAFSAAIPGQGGYMHVNEQWPEYWADLFYANGYVMSECLRDEFWDDPAVEPWYRQNLLLASSAQWFDDHGIEFTRYPRAVVHPAIFTDMREMLSR